MKNSPEPRQQKWTYGYTPEQYKRFARGGLKLLLMFSFLYCTIYCMRQNITYGGQYLVEELGWGKGYIGILTGTMFWTYGLGHLVNGRLSERVGPPKFIIGSVVLSFLANISMGLVGYLPPMGEVFGLPGLLIVMAIIWGLNGYFQSMAWASGIAVITNWWPSDRRGFAVGFAQAFSGFGTALASLSVLGAMTVGGDVFGWRAVFFLPSLLPFAMLLVYLLFSRTSPEKIGLPAYVEKNAANTAAEDEMKDLVKSRGILFPYVHLMKNTKFILFVLVALFMGVSCHGMTQWVPFYFAEVHGVSVEESLLGSLALPIGMAAGTLVVPFITDKLCPTNRMPAVLVSALLSAVAIFCFLPLDPTKPVQLVLIQILLFVAGFGIFAVDGIVFTFATDVGGRVFSATAAGILDCAVYLGAAVQSIVFGFVFDLNTKMVFYTMVALCAALAVLALIGSKMKDEKSE